MYEYEIKRKYEWKDGKTYFCKIQFEYMAECKKFRGVRTVVGSCDCEAGDKFKPEFGYRFAKVKALKRMFAVIKRLMLLETHQPEWRKEEVFYLLPNTTFMSKDVEISNWSKNNFKIKLNGKKVLIEG